MKNTFANYFDEATPKGIVNEGAKELKQMRTQARSAMKDLRNSIELYFDITDSKSDYDALMDDYDTMKNKLEEYYAPFKI